MTKTETLLALAARVEAGEGKTCKANGCGKPHAARGFCNTHFAAARRRGELKKKTIQIDWLKKNLSLVTPEACALWPFGVNHNGYGSLHFKGKTKSVNWVVCTLIHGPAADVSLQAAHSCGNRLCFNPFHIYWATPKENAKDRQEHGTVARGAKQGSSKLTEDQALAIKIECMSRTRTFAEIGRDFGVSKDTVGDIAKGRTWAWLEAPTEPAARLAALLRALAEKEKEE